MKYFLTLTVCFLFTLTSFSQEKSNTNTQQVSSVSISIESSSKTELLSSEEVKEIFSKTATDNNMANLKCRVIEKKFNKIKGYKHRSLRA